MDLKLVLIICILFVFQEYPEYYQVIKDPIDLRAIDSKIKAGVFTLNLCKLLC